MSVVKEISYLSNNRIPQTTTNGRSAAAPAASFKSNCVSKFELIRQAPIDIRSFSIALKRLDVVLQVALYLSQTSQRFRQRCLIGNATGRFNRLGEKLPGVLQSSLSPRFISQGDQDVRSTGHNGDSLPSRQMVAYRG